MWLFESDKVRVGVRCVVETDSDTGMDRVVGRDVVDVVGSESVAV